MRPTLRYYDLPGLNLIYDPVYFIDSSAPPALAIPFQRLRFAKALKGITLDVLDKSIDPPQGFLVLVLPVEV